MEWPHDADALAHRTAAEAFWRRCRRLTLALAALWVALNVGGPWIARDLYGLLGSGFPFGFWFMAQGSLLLYLLLIIVLVVASERMERQFIRSLRQESPTGGSDPAR